MTPSMRPSASGVSQRTPRGVWCQPAVGWAGKGRGACTASKSAWPWPSHTATSSPSSRAVSVRRCADSPWQPVGAVQASERASGAM